MSVEGAGPRQGAETVTDSPQRSGTGDEVVPDRPGDEDQVIPERRDVRGISDLTYSIITPYLSNPLLQRAVWIVLLALTLVCLIATGVRLSPLPLLPVPLFAVAYYALRRARAAGGDNDRSLLIWFLALLAAGLAGFWVLSMVSDRFI